jgi:hypothetical protein
LSFSLDNVREREKSKGHEAEQTVSDGADEKPDNFSDEAENTNDEPNGAPKLGHQFDLLLYCSVKALCDLNLLKTTVHDITKILREIKGVSKAFARFGKLDKRTLHLLHLSSGVERNPLPINAGFLKNNKMR